MNTEKKKKNLLTVPVRMMYVVNSTEVTKPTSCLPTFKNSFETTCFETVFCHHWLF